jgi:FkbM family methyltransferase
MEGNRMPINRKRFLQSTGWAAAGASLGALGGSSVGPARTGLGVESFSQCGEDVAVEYILKRLYLTRITYLDIGANDPIDLSNTYHFYRAGHRGVLVEPNVSLCEKLRAVRPGDTTLVAGIGVTAQAEADYFIMNRPALNTFSREDAEHQVQVTKGKYKVEKVIKMPLLNINDVIREHFKEAPTFLSVDTEGLDLAILESLDYSRYRPAVICAETLVPSTTKVLPEIAEFVAGEGYVARGGSFVNTIFVDGKLF